ncbi:MAG: hypothetical protein H0W67_07270 [Gemmatimonadales bacterium]|nr:hypothetical protein [Gemmatimonadales bacterium]
MRAQTSGAINVTATVLSALSVTGTNLAFGNVAPTQTKTVSAATGGTFTVSGAASAPVAVLFTLPTTMGANVAVGTWTGLSNTLNNSGTAAALTVSATPQSLAIGAGGNLYVWVGATLTTTAATPGSYSAPVTLTVVYN